jgi:hypothetical protein
MRDGRMPCSEEAVPGVKKADWQAPERLGEPSFVFGPLRHPSGIMVEQLCYDRCTILRACQRSDDTDTTDTTNTN